jgi:membrane peptidoglycan carboxypeptidase
MGYATLFNDGIYHPPTILKIGPDHPLGQGRRVFSSDTSYRMRSLLRLVVMKGTGKKADAPGYRVGGKTGTAQKLINGRYSHSDHNASFVGFVPSRSPELAIVVVIDSAKGPNGDHGGTVAAPIFRNIAESSLHYLGVPPDENPAPPILVAGRESGEEPQPPPAPDHPNVRPPDSRVQLVANADHTVPDLEGMSAREAVRRLVAAGMTAKLSGDGFVVAQDPPAGEPIGKTTVCRLTLERRPARRPPVERQ